MTFADFIAGTEMETTTISGAPMLAIVKQENGVKFLELSLRTEKGTWRVHQRPMMADHEIKNFFNSAVRGCAKQKTAA